MEIRDPIHGSIHIPKSFEPIIKAPFFQRLRNIKQLGLTEYVFPGATHTRFLHSIGAMSVSEKAFNSLFSHLAPSTDLLRLKMTTLAAMLLHDIGHAPLSHSTESVMPSIKELKLPKQFCQGNEQEQANHEHYSIKIITDSSFTLSLREIKNEFGVTPESIASLISGTKSEEEYFIYKGKNYFPILHQLITSELDCDRMDYLLRDSYFCGVSYGNFDLDWTIDNLDMCEIGNDIYLGLNERCISTFDDFLLSRYHMFLMVYFHYKPVCLEKMLEKILNQELDYKIPSDIEKYREHDDYHLEKIMRSCKTDLTERFLIGHIPEKLFESFTQDQHSLIAPLEKYLQSKNLEYIKCESSNRVSKYYSSEIKKTPFPIKVIRKNKYSGSVASKNINEVTSLYEKYQETHMVNRIHLDLDEVQKEYRKEIFNIIKG